MARKAGAEILEAPIGSPIKERYPITVDVNAQQAGLAHAISSAEPGGVCTSTSIFFSNEVPIPFADMFLADVTLKIGVAHSRPLMTKVMDLIVNKGLDLGRFTTMVVPWDAAAENYRKRTTKLILSR